MHIDRRTFLGSCGVAASTTLVAGCASANAPGKDRAARDLPDIYNVSIPQENLDAFVKVCGHLDGSPAWYSAQGRIYLIRDGEMPLPLVAVEGVRYTRFEKLSDGYRHHMRDWAIYRDLDTGEMLTQFTNPVTGKVNKPNLILTRMLDWKLSPETGQTMEGYTGEAWLIDRPFNLPWKREGNDLSVTYELMVKYASGTGGGEWFQLLSHANELNDPTRSGTSARLAWTGHSPLMRWLEMDGYDGRTLWQSTGRKHSSMSDIRPAFVKDVNTIYPGSLEDPEGYVKPR